MMGYLSLEDYGIIGNAGHAALVSRFGSIEWCSFPNLESPSHFASILDETQGGRFQLMPQGEFHSEQHYLQRTQVLETAFETPYGRALLLDWMPFGDEPGSGEPVIYRRLETIQGRVQFLLHCGPRFEYGHDAGAAEWQNGDILFRGNNPGLIARLTASMSGMSGASSPSVPLEISQNRSIAQARFTLETGQSAVFRWSWGFSRRLFTSPGIPHGIPLGDSNPRATSEAWRAWAHRCIPAGCPLAGPWHDTVTRSSIYIRVLSHPETGAIAQSVTTSIPGAPPRVPADGRLSDTGEEFRTGRTWDYRYAWIRDGVWALQALANLGYSDDCKAWFRWLTDLLMRDGAEGLQPLYSLDGGRASQEDELHFLAGYQGVKPVRIGNLASSIFQLDLYGNVMLAAAEYYRYFDELPEGLWPRLASITDFACQAWRRPDHGFWEMRSKPEHFVVSKLFCWAALDRAILLARALKQQIPARWGQEREILHRTICQQGFDDSIGSFVRSFGNRSLDSATLLMPILGFLPMEDPRIAGTLSALQTELADGVLLRRYQGDDGLAGHEASHLLSSLWFVYCLALAGRASEASDRLAELCSYATPLGIFGEQVDLSSGETTGNFPSASVHLGLINAALYVGAARGRQILTGHLLGFPELPLAKSA
jgi:GH15 family glucan-1,4-alpha-glucosidase